MREKLVLADLFKKLKEWDPKPNLDELRKRFVLKIRKENGWIAEVIAILFFGCLLFALIAAMLMICRGC